MAVADVYARPAVGSALYLVVISFLKEDRGRKQEIEMLLRARRAAAATLQDLSGTPASVQTASAAP